MTIGELLAKHGVKLKDTAPGRYYTACPRCSSARSKEHQSNKVLGVTIKTDGSVHFGCSHCGWAGPEKGSGRRERTSAANRYYDYGERLRKARGANKQFWWEHLDGGRWIKGTGGADTQILYRIEEVRRAISEDRTIAIVEGEKDTDALWHIEMPATCNAHGASEADKKPKWTAAHSKQLADGDIVVLNDNDPAGYAHADAICKLSHGIAKRVRRLDLKISWPAIPKGGDVSDWLAVGGEHTAERLRELIEAAPDYVPADAATAKPEPEQTNSGDDDDAELARLAKLDPLSYGRARKDTAKQLGVSVTLLDAAVRAKRSELGLDAEADGRQGRAIEFPEPEPWPHLVDGAALLDQLAETIGAYVVMPEASRDAIALWTVHSYLLDRFFISPRLAIRSPTKQCGKTTLIDVLSHLVLKPLRTDSVSPSALFRVIAAHRPTILIDEADAFARDNDELRGILNSGHRQGGHVLRNVGDEHEPRAFATFGAVAIAAIGTLPETLIDRSVVVFLKRRLPSERITAFRADRTEALDLLARKIARWAQDHAEAVAATDPDMPPGVVNRTCDNWRPLVAIAEVVGGDWPARACKAILTGRMETVDEASRTELLLGDIRDTFAALNLDWIGSAEIIKSLAEITPRPWAEYGRSGKPITANKLARLLKPLGIAPERLEIGEDRARGYFRTHFDDAFERYLGVSKCPPVREPYKSGTSGTFQSVRDPTPRTDAKVQETQHSSHRGRMDTLKSGNGAHTQNQPPEAPPAARRLRVAGAPWLELIGPEPDGTACAQCGASDGTVYLIRDPARGVACEPLHEPCGRFFFPQGN